MPRRASPLLAVLLAVTMAGCAERLFFYPDRVAYTTPQSLGTPVEPVFLPGPDGAKLHGWWMPAHGRARGTVLQVHGNAANVSNHAPLVAWLAAEGFNVLAFDYRGFGRSDGSPTLNGVVDDTGAALDWLRQRPDIDTSRIAVLGHSLGGASALRAVARSQQGVRLVVIDSAFDSYRGIARDAASRMGPIGWLAPLVMGGLPGEADDPLRAIPKLTMPVIVMHGSADNVIPPSHGRALWEAAREPKQWWPIEQGMHLDALSRAAVRERLRAALHEFLG